jgi:hypothetical protein
MLFIRHLFDVLLGYLQVSLLLYRPNRVRSAVACCVPQRRKRKRKYSKNRRNATGYESAQNSFHLQIQEGKIQSTRDKLIYTRRCFFLPAGRNSDAGDSEALVYSMSS